MNRNEIIDAYLFLRKNNHSIPDDTLDFMKNASLRALESMNSKSMYKCDKHGGIGFCSDCAECNTN